MATTSRAFLKAAQQRLTTAEFLSKHKYNLDAMYLAGYAVECALKSLILELTAPADRNQVLQDITSGRKMHDIEALRGRLKRLNRTIPLEINRRLRRSNWSTALRYESGRGDTGETVAFLKTARAIIDWVDGESQEDFNESKNTP